METRQFLSRVGHILLFSILILVLLTLTDETKAQSPLFCIPTSGSITQRAHSGHMALDIAGPSTLPGNPVYAPYDGTVVYVGRADLGSNYRHAVAINHGYINTRGKYVLSFYVHMGHGTQGYATVNIGDTIQRGQLIGYQGDAGLAYGVHLHWEVREFDIPFLDQYTHWGDGHCQRTDLWYEFGGGGGCGDNPNPAIPINPELYTGTLSYNTTETCSVSTPSTPEGFVDAPAPNETVAGIKRIAGWARVAGSTISRIEIWIDGIKRANATYGTSRPDAGGNYGWYWDWNTTSYGNGTHSIQVKAIAANGQSKILPNANEGSAPTTTNVTVQNSYVPNAPTDFRTINATTNSLTIGWKDNSSNEDGFKIYRWMYQSEKWDFFYYKSVGRNVTSYTDTGLDCDSTYWYKITAYDGGYESALPAYFLTAYTANCPLNQPTDFRTINATANSLTIGWTDNSSSETGFKIYKWMYQSGSWDFFYHTSVGSNVTAYTDTGLDCDSTYWYKITAYNSNYETPLPAYYLTAYTADCPPEITGYIESVQPHSIVGGVTQIKGWAKIDGSNISRVEIWIDGVQRGTATYGTSRPDIGGNYGWYWNWNTTNYGNGTHLIQIKAIAVDGQSKMLPNWNGSQPTITQVNIHNHSIFLPLITKMPGASNIDYVIAFSSREEDGFNIWIADVTGQHIKQLTSAPKHDLFPRWSPDGSQISFLSVRSGSKQIWVMNANGTNQRQLTNDVTSGDYYGITSWLPNGTGIRYSPPNGIRGELYDIYLDGTKTQITNHGQKTYYPDIQLSTEKMLYTRQSGSWSPTEEIYVSDFDGNKEQQLTQNSHNDRYGRWSPDGSTIAWSASENENGYGSPHNVFIMNADGSNKRKLTHCTAPTDCEEPAWSPSGAQLIYTKNNGDGTSSIWKMNTDGTNNHPIISNGIFRSPDWLWSD